MDKERYLNLVKKLNNWTLKYEQGAPEVSDVLWDDIYFKIQKWENENNFYAKNSPTQKIIYEVKNELKKVTHNHLMLSADKTKDWNTFINYFSNKDVVGMLKEDGLTCSLKYINGKLISAETRGDGEIGEDILHNAFVIKSIPKKITIKEELVIDGEIICTYQDFKPFSDDYANPRNFAAGSIRLLDNKECEKRNLTFVAWNVVKGLTDNVLDNFYELEKMGFTVVPHTSSFDYDAKEFLINKAKELGHPIDGLIGRFTDRKYGESLGATGHHSRSIYAFKFYNEIKETKLLNIIYEPSRNGTMTPIAVFEPIKFGDSVVTKCSLHNLSIMEELNNGKAYIGDILSIIKANEIIPQCIKWQSGEQKEEIKIPKVCPICEHGTIINISNNNIKTLSCSNENCSSKIINKINHYCSKKGMDIEHLSEKTIKFLLDNNYISTIKDLYCLHEKAIDFMHENGYGIKSVNNIINSIHKSTMDVKLNNFIAAMGIPLIGQTAAKELIKHFENYNDFRKMVKSDTFDFSSISGFGYEMNKSLKEFDYSEFDKIAELLTFKKNELNKEKEENLLNDLNFVITGSLKEFKNRDELKELIETNNGKVVSSISKNTNYLINNDINSTSSKNKKAKDLKIPIISEKDFLKMIGR